MMPTIWFSVRGSRLDWLQLEVLDILKLRFDLDGELLFLSARILEIVNFAKLTCKNDGYDKDENFKDDKKHGYRKDV